MIKVSIVIPTYNRGYIIEKSLQYILKQDYENIEIIISDNCSTDNTSEIISKYIIDKRIKYFKNRKNLGLIGNYNIALKEYATGDFIMFVPDDDILLNKDYVSKAVNLIHKYTLSWIAAGSYYINIKEKKLKKNINKDFLLFKENDFFKFHKWGFDNFAGLTILFDRKKAISLGGFIENLYNFDLELIFKMTINNNVAILNSPEALYAITQDQSNYLIDESYMFNGYTIYKNIENLITNKEIEKDLNKNIKNYITACFRYFIDRDAFGEMKFNDEYWFNYFKNLEGGKYFPFFDEDTQKRYKLFKKDKEKFKEQRQNTFSNTWKKIEEKEILDFTKAFYD